jgi:hypothetical protein
MSTAIELATSGLAIFSSPKSDARRIQLVENGEWDKFLFGHFHRSQSAYVLWQIQNELDDRTYWSLLGRAWCNSDNNWQDLWRWVSMFWAERPHKEHVMSEEDREVLASLPETLTIYRGCNAHSKHGLSWTLDKEFAERFSRERHGFWFPADKDGNLKDGMYRARPRVYERTITKSDAIAYFGARQESEIITTKFLREGTL